jgi:ADP-heptose:LPS heptosyltransferase
VRRKGPARKVLVIKHGALGDIVFALPAMRAIRAHHADAHITLQTTPPFADFLSASGYADAIDPLGRQRGLGAGLALAMRLRKARYDLVYELQRSDRAAILRWFVAPLGPDWCGLVVGDAKRLKALNEKADAAHIIDALAEQIAPMGAPGELARRAPDVSWAVARGKPPAAFGIEGDFLLIAAAASAHRDEKRWPGARFAEIARNAARQGLGSVFVGGAGERAALDAISEGIPRARNLAGETSLFDLASLGAAAKGAVGNDTGPAILAAAAGAPTVTVYSRHSPHPNACAPRGPGGVIAIRREEIADVSVEEVTAALSRLGVFS